jgi:hypothetical protein
LVSALVQRAFADPVARRALLEIDAAVNGSAGNGGGQSDLRRSIETRLKDALRQGRLQIATEDLGGYASTREVFEEAAHTAGEKIARERQLARAREERSRVADKTFIAIVLENQKGEPVPNALCRLRLTDGTLREVRLDAEGRLRVPGIDPGQCEVSFPEYDGGEWQQI